MTKILILIAITISPCARAEEKLVAECSGRSYLHQIFLLNETPITPTSFRYERRTFFGNSLQESYPVRLEDADPFEKKITFISFEAGAIFAVSAGSQRKFLRGQPGLQATAYNYRKPGSGGPLDYTGNCWIDYELALKLPTWLK